MLDMSFTHCAYSVPRWFGRLLSFVFIVLVCLATTSVLAQGSPNIAPQQASQPEVLVLGVVHFIPSQTDANKPQVDNMFGEKRQSELSVLLKQLARFRPTKIAFEVPYGYLPGDPEAAQPEVITPARERYYNENVSRQIDEDYSNYLAGKLQLTQRETHQIGFRLAKMLGMNNVYAVDYKLSLPEAPPITDSDKAALAPIEREIHQVVSRLDELQKRDTLSNWLAYVNSPQFDRLGAIYLRQCQIAGNSGIAGAESASRWYERNLIIYGKLRRIVTSPNDRILLIYGAGRADLLREFIRDSGDLKTVDPLSFLKSEQ
jgi:hypothetical protein